jgi:hypothetical protein
MWLLCASLHNCIAHAYGQMMETSLHLEALHEAVTDARVSQRARRERERGLDQVEKEVRDCAPSALLPSDVILLVHSVPSHNAAGAALPQAPDRPSPRAGVCVCAFLRLFPLFVFNTHYRNPRVRWPMQRSRR